MRHGNRDGLGFVNQDRDRRGMVANRADDCPRSPTDADFFETGIMKVWKRARVHLSGFLRASWRTVRAT